MIGVLATCERVSYVHFSFWFVSGVMVLSVIIGLLQETGNEKRR